MWHDLKQWPAVGNLRYDIKFDGFVKFQSRYSLGFQIGRAYEKSRYEVEFQKGHFNVRDINLAALSESANASGKCQELTVNGFRTRAVSEHLNGLVAVVIFDRLYH